MIRLLHRFDYYGESETIEIAKGKYKMPMTFGEAVKKVKRERAWRKLKRG